MSAEKKEGLDSLTHEDLQLISDLVDERERMKKDLSFLTNEAIAIKFDVPRGVVDHLLRSKFHRLTVLDNQRDEEANVTPIAPKMRRRRVHLHRTIEEPDEEPDEIQELTPFEIFLTTGKVPLGN